MSQSKNPITTGQIQASNGEYYPDSVYQETNRATGTQKEVANMWARGDLPTHSTSGDAVKLYTSSGNFKGYQYPDGRGKLKHYNHIQAIRTRNGLIIGDSSCYGKGWAHCSYPNETDHYIDVTTLDANLRGREEDIYDIIDVDEENDEVRFEGGTVYDLETGELVESQPPSAGKSILGL